MIKQNVVKKEKIGYHLMILKNGCGMNQVVKIKSLNKKV